MAEYPIRPNLLKDKSECLLNFKADLKFVSNNKIRDMIKRHYALEQLVYPDVSTQAYMLQAHADEIRNLYNHLYDLIGFAEAQSNPLENYDRFEEWTDDTTGSGNNKYSEFPMDNNSEKDVSHNKSDSTGKLKHVGRVHGNIGVMTLGTAEEQTEEMYRRLYSLEKQYVEEFKDYFMVTM